MMEKKIYFTPQQHQNLWNAVHHKDTWEFWGADTNWKVSVNPKTQQLVYDKESTGFKSMRYGAIICGAFVFSIAPKKDCNFIRVILSHVCSLTGFCDNEDWPGGVMTVAIFDFQPEDVTKDYDETLRNLMRYVDDYIEHTVVNNEIPAKELANKDGHWDRYY